MPRVVMIGLTTIDVIHVNDRPVAPNAKVTAARQLLAAGGPAANAAVCAAGLGCHVQLVTALGDHPLATLAARDLTSHGVHIIDVAGAVRDIPPPLSQIRVSTHTGERSVSSLNDGALAAAIRTPISRDIAALIASANAVLVDGYYRQILTAVVDELRAHPHLLVDLGSWKDSYELVLRGADIVAASADARLPGRRDPLTGILAAGAHCAMITRGGQPLQVATAGGIRCEVPVPQVDAIDTLGAGDVFHGALSAARAWHPDRCPVALGEYAAQIASRACTSLGARTYLTNLPARLGLPRQ